MPKSVLILVMSNNFNNLLINIDINNINNNYFAVVQLLVSFF